MKEAEVFYLKGIGDIQSSVSSGTEYANQMAPRTEKTCLRLNLDSEFVPIFDSHLRDLNLVFFDETENDLTVVPPLSLTVLKAHNGDNTYNRYMLISRQEIERREELLRDTLTNLGLIEAPRPAPQEDQSDKMLKLIEGDEQSQKLMSIALDWAFSDLSMVALNNSCYMQQNYPKYLPDFNGQSDFYHTERTISSTYALQHPDAKIDVEEDSKSMEQGFGIMMLHDALLAHGIVHSTTDANKVIEVIRQIIPTAFRAEEIAERLGCISPDKDVRSKIAQFALATFDPNIDLDEDIVS